MAGLSNEINRSEWVRETLEKIPPGGRILDAGAGERQYRKFCSHLKYVSQDFAQYDGAGDGSGLQMEKWDTDGLDIRSDITSIPEPDESFDAVMCTEVLEHLPSPDVALREFSRLLKSGGYLILTAPFCSLTHFSPFHYYSGFNRFFYEKYMVETGFDILRIERNGNFFEFLAQELRRIPSTAEKYALDRPGIFEKFALNLILRMLKRFSQKDKGSSELLCFGYHVLAKKR